MSLNLFILLLICCFELSLCDLTCAWVGDGACDWSCRLKGREGRCRLDQGEEQFSCSCFGEIGTDLDLFGDHDDDEYSDDALEEGSFPSFLNQIIFLRLSQSYIFRSREKL